MSDPRSADPRALVPAAMDRFTTRVRDVDAARAWDASTPCSEWSVRDLVAHLCFEHLWAPHVLAGTPMDEVGDRYDGDLLQGDPPGAWRRAVARSRPLWTATAGHAAQGHTSFGWLPIGEYARLHPQRPDHAHRRGPVGRAGASRRRHGPRRAARAARAARVGQVLRS